MRPSLDDVPDYANIVTWRDESDRETFTLVQHWSCPCGAFGRCYEDEPPIARNPSMPVLVLKYPTVMAQPGRPGCPSCGAAMLSRPGVLT